MDFRELHHRLPRLHQPTAGTLKAHNFHTYTKVLAAQTLHAVGYAMGLNFDADIAAETGAAAAPAKGQATDPANDTAEARRRRSTSATAPPPRATHTSPWSSPPPTTRPVLFFVQNNRWAISVPFEVQSRVPVSTRAAGYGFEGMRVDGNDVLAVLAVNPLRHGEDPRR